MTKDEIDDAVCEIMMNDGPDRHVDGHEVLTDFIMALLSGNGEAWIKEYLEEDEWITRVGDDAV